MYTVADYGRMMADATRMAAYEQAMRRSIRPGDVVVDLGAGAGIMTLLACRLGAAKVHAIETSPALRIARAICKANGVADRVVFHEADARTVRLPEPADVIVSDLRGALPLYGGHLETLADARARWLKPGGILLPLRDALRVGLVSAPAFWSKMVGPWERADLDLSAGRRVVTDSLHPRGIELGPDDLLAPAETWATLTYGEAPTHPIHGRAAFVATRAAEAHGLALWFDATIAEGIGYSNEPGQDLIYGITMAPLAEPVAVRAGQRVEVELFAHRNVEDYVWGWTTAFEGGPTFRQTSLGEALAWEHTVDREVPASGPLVDALRQALGHIDGVRSVEALTRVALDALPAEGATPGQHSRMQRLVRALGRALLSAEKR